MYVLFPYMNYTFLESQGMKYKVKDAIFKKTQNQTKKSTNQTKTHTDKKHPNIYDCLKFILFYFVC